MTATLAFVEDFARWYMPLDMEVDEAVLDKRRAGALALADEASRDDIEALVRMAFKSRHSPSTASLARLRGPFKSQDDTFLMQGNERELQILCAAIIAELLRRDGLVAAYAALAVTTCSMGGLRRADLPLDLVQAAEFALTRQGEMIRRRPELGTLLAGEPTKPSTDKLITKLQTQQDVAATIEALTALSKDMKSAHAALWKRCTEALTVTNTIIALQDEELDMLWWLVGGRSQALDCLFPEIPEPQRVLVLSKELADMTSQLPGTRSAKALLTRVGVTSGQQVSIQDSVNSCNPEWVKRATEDISPSAVTTPIYLALKTRQETGDPAQWTAAWRAITELDPTHAHSALVLAQQFYRESLLVAGKE